MKITRCATVVAGTLFCFCITHAQAPPAAPKLKDEMRMPWTRGEDRFLRLWLIAAPVPGRLDSDCLGGQGGEASLRPADGQELKKSDGASLRWHSQKSWGDEVAFDNATGSAEGAVAFAFTTIPRPSAGRAMLSIGSIDGIRLWLNGTLVLSRDGLRSMTPDEDQVEVEMNAGENRLLVKVPVQSRFCVRVLESGTVLVRKAEIGPSIVKLASDGFTLKTDVGAERTTVDAVNVEVIKPGGEAVFSATAPRGAQVEVDAREWADGPYEVRCSTRTFTGLLYATHIPWYKGEFLPMANELAATAAAADASKPEGFTLGMLAAMVEDRLGCRLSEVKGNPWRKVHSPLMEYQEMLLERNGQTGRIRPYGFVRLAYLDDVDGSPQYCRAYLPPDYDPAKKWPLVIQMHGFNPANPVYVRWWAADDRHPGINTEFSNHQGVIYMEPHGRGNTQYLGMGDKDIQTVIAEAKRLFNVDEDRIYLTGDSMGGWGTWNVATRHPDEFAAIAPVFGGSDYHAQMPEEELARLAPADRFLFEKQSSWAMADGLLNLPVFVHHGDADQSVNVDYSRWGVRLMQRWGYDVRYHEYPGRVHEALESQNGNLNIEWFLQHRRNADPRHVRLRSAELRHASAYWVHVLQSASPLAFMAVDAEIVDGNVIRLDTRNIVDIELTPSANLVDQEKSVNVVWNGEPRQMSLENGSLRLTAAGYKPATVHKNERLPGSIADFTVTPFAVVIGTVSRDTAMAALCRAKASGFIEGWKEWQKQQPRVFADTALGEADMAKYSLLLVGGPDANSVTARLAPRLPLQISGDRIAVDGRDFAVKDAALQMIYPHPLNAERYVWIAAGTSTTGMYFSELNPRRLYDWDYVIADGLIPAYRQRASALQTRVVSGMFDGNWRFNDSLAQRGDAGIRSKARLRLRPNENLAVSPRLLDSYVGRYQIIQGPVVEVVRDGRRLKARVQGSDEDTLVPETETNFTVPRSGAWISFVRDRSGKVTGFQAYQDGDFEGKKLDK
ncbi:MAG TPA: prolyl oligopeptidase family serine peptidase [Bacteroidota bacterium]|nr:prolyl oligopeptidase family serine peptidase [Bacteroidota bacterium]